MRALKVFKVCLQIKFISLTTNNNNANSNRPNLAMAEILAKQKRLESNSYVVGKKETDNREHNYLKGKVVCVFFL